MGKRGPKPGFKKAREASASAPSSAPDTPIPKVAAKKAPAKKAAAKKAPVKDLAQPASSVPIDKPVDPVPEAEQVPITAADRENPNKLTGQALRELAHRRGMARSVLADMPEEKIRMELRYITHRQYS